MSFAAESFAAHLARAVDLFRDPEKKEDQKRVFRALVAMLQGQSVTVRVVGGRISVNGAPIDGPQLGPLLQRLELHGVGEMTIPQDAPVSQRDFTGWAETKFHAQSNVVVHNWLFFDPMTVFPWDEEVVSGETLSLILAVNVRRSVNLSEINRAGMAPPSISLRQKQLLIIGDHQ